VNPRDFSSKPFEIRALWIQCRATTGYGIPTTCNFTELSVRRRVRLMHTLEDQLEHMTFAPPPEQWRAVECERDRLRLLLEGSASVFRPALELITGHSGVAPAVDLFFVIRRILRVIQMRVIQVGFLSASRILRA
jgi:hypothetical protein